MKALSRGVAGFIFGLSVTVLFISVWGRAVVVDSGALAEAAAPLSQSETVVEVVGEWLAAEIEEAGVPVELVDPAVAAVMETSLTAQVLESLVVEIVEAAATLDPDEASVDVAEVLEPAIPEVVAVLAELGIAVTEDQVLEGLHRLDPLVIRDATTAPYVGPRSPVAGRLGTATVLAAVALLIAGGFLVASAPDRLTELRRLLTRFAVGGFSFMILLRLGSWALDPRGGRTPVAETVSNLLSSQQKWPMILAAAAGALALGIFVVRRLLRRGPAPSPRDETAPTQGERELVGVGSGHGG
jgi:hypothetical protein